MSKTCIRDQHGNHWRLGRKGESGSYVQVLAADGDGYWRVLPEDQRPPIGEWEDLKKDDLGFIWITGEKGRYRFDPRKPQKGWLATGGNSLFDTNEEENEFGPWKELDRLPAGNHDIVSVTHEGKLFISGGLTSYYGLPAGTHVFSEIFMYDPEVDEWAVVGKMSQPRCYNGLVCLGDELWMLGGYANISDPTNRNAPRVPIDSVEIFNLKTKQWKSGPALTSSRSELLAFSGKGRVFVIGGADSDQKSMTRMESISPDETEWRREADLPLPMRQYAGCVINDVFYVCHGGDGLFAYDVNGGQWFDVPQPPAKPRAPTMAAYKGEVWISAGQDVGNPVGTFIYSPDKRSWRNGPDAPSPQAWAAASELKGRLVFVGGAHWSEEAGYFIFDDRTFVLNEEIL